MSQANPSTLVLIPAFNERKNIARVVRAIRSLGYETLVVDDGSTDGSPEILKDLDTHFLLSAANRGKGATLRLGFEWFLQRPYDFLVLVDADGQHAPDEIALFLEKLKKGAHMVVGDRLQKCQAIQFGHRKIEDNHVG